MQWASCGLYETLTTTKNTTTTTTNIKYQELFRMVFHGGHFVTLEIEGV